jgi:hypothetical protein
MDDRIADGDTPYWVFVCNPRMWAIDRFLKRGIERDGWGVRQSDHHRFGPGQLGIVRVGVDRRTVAESQGRPRLEPGIYAICEVESGAFPGPGTKSEFSAPGRPSRPGWPTVQLHYLRNFLGAPLTIARLRVEAPQISPLLLNGFEASSFQIPADDFHMVMTLLGGGPTGLVSLVGRDDVSANELAELEKKYLNASPKTKERLSRLIERGKVGALVKKLMGFQCQLCAALGNNPLGFLKTTGEPYVEAHHVMPVSTMEVGSLSASNVMTVCANHHRQMHYGEVDVTIGPKAFEIAIDGRSLTIPRLSIGAAVPTAP